MNFILSALLVVASFLACFVEDSAMLFFPPETGKAAVFSFRAQFPFNFDQEKAFGSKRELAVSQYIPLYSPIPDRIESERKQMADLLKKIAELQGEHADGAAFSKYLRKEIGLEMDERAAGRILEYQNVRNLLEAVVTIQESILQGKIVEDSRPIRGKKTAEVLYPDPVGTVAYPVAEFVTIGQARENLQKKIVQVFWQVDKKVLDSVVQIAMGTLQPNLRYDQRENDRRIEEIIRRYPSRLVPYDTGDVLVPFRKVMTEEDVLLLAAYREDERKVLFESAPWILFSISFLVFLYNLLLTKVLRPWLHRKPPVLLFLSLLLLTLLILKTFLLFTPYPVNSIPFCLLPILLVLLQRERISTTWTTLLGATLVSLLLGRSAELLLFFVLGGLLTVLVTPAIRKRSHVFLPSLLVAAANASIVIVFLLDWKTLALWAGGSPPPGASLNTLFNHDLLVETGWAAVGGLGSGPAALLLLPLVEFAWRTASTFQLDKYADLHHPLLKELLARAPGTYQHTMSVAFLAEAAGEAVGADTLLLRTGAYYHDIGKMANPRFFVENQMGQGSLHDQLGPLESVRIIIGHVEAGMAMARKAGLHRSIADFIPEHHGTRLVEFFYDKACKENPESQPDVRDFQYPGPKPQSRETAILMIVDAVEATSRTLHEPTRARIEAMVRYIIERRMAEGQFDECSLSTRDIGIIVRVLTDSIEASCHARVEYPWQKQEKAEDEQRKTLPGGAGQRA